MPFDLRRCAQAAVQAAVVEAFKPADPEPEPPRRHRHRLGPVRAVLVGAGVVTAGRVLLNGERRQAIADAVSRRLPLEEILNDLDEGDEADSDRASRSDDQAQDQSPGSARVREAVHG